jgi:NAD(P)-dependent dehydrogenase (short-subunit alcohol dehydrogenase family)
MDSLPFLGKTVLITGASRGLGRTMAAAFWQQGADVFLLARSEENLAAICNQLAGDSAGDQRAGFLPVDLAAPEAPARIFASFREFSSKLDVLVNNAAILGPVGPVDENDWEQWQHAIQINLLAPVALCRLAVRQMKAQGGGAIVNLSGGGATAPRPFFSAYATAKAGLVRFTETIAAETGRYGIRVNAIAPGPMHTEMMDAVVQAGPSLAGETEYRKAMEEAQRAAPIPATPAELAVFLASETAAGINGRLISAVWDPWKDLARHAAELARSDVYTLRRIVPEDRNFRWV